MTRDEAARAFAEKMRPFPQATMDKTCEQCGHSIHATCHAIFHDCPSCYFAIADLPAPDAPLHEHLAFVGRVAEAIEVREFAIESPTYRAGDASFRVTFWPGISGCPGDATDLCWAALLAALAALEAR